MNQFHPDPEQGWMPIRKWDNDRFIKGYISKEQVDVDGEVIPIALVQKNLEDHGSNIIINYEHSMTDKGTVPLGQIVAWRKSADNKAIEIIAGLYKGTRLQDDIWTDIKKSDGKAGFSVGGAIHKKACDSVTGLCKLTDVDIVEISFTKAPANKAAVLTGVNKMAKNDIEEAASHLEKAGSLLRKAVDPNSSMALNETNPPHPHEAGKVEGKKQAKSDLTQKAECPCASKSNPTPSGAEGPATSGQGFDKGTEATDMGGTEDDNDKKDKKGSSTGGTKKSQSIAKASPEVIQQLEALLAQLKAESGAADMGTPPAEEEQPMEAQMTYSKASMEKAADAAVMKALERVLPKALPNMVKAAITDAGPHPSPEGLNEDVIGGGASGEGQGVKPKDSTEAYSASKAAREAHLRKAARSVVHEELARLRKAASSGEVDGRTKNETKTEPLRKFVRGNASGFIDSLKKSDPKRYSQMVGISFDESEVKNQ